MHSFQFDFGSLVLLLTEEKKERKADLSVKVRTNEQKLYTVRTVINRCVPKPNHLSSNERLTVVNKN